MYIDCMHHRIIDRLVRMILMAGNMDDALTLVCWQLIVQSDKRLTWEWHRNIDNEELEMDTVDVCNKIYQGLGADCVKY